MIEIVKGSDALRMAVEAGIRLARLGEDPQLAGEWAARTFRLTAAERVAVVLYVVRGADYWPIVFSRSSRELRSRQGGRE